MTIKEIRESGMLEQNVLGCLSEQDVRTVEGYLIQYPELQYDYLEIQLAIQAYAKSKGVVPRRNLEAEIKALILAEGGQIKVGEKQKSTSTKKKTKSSQSLFVSGKRVFLFLLGAITMFSTWSAFEKDTHYKELQQSYNSIKTDCNNKQARQNAIINIYKQINNPSSKTMNFIPTDVYPETNLLFHFNPVEKQNYIQIKNLPGIASNQAFQLWALKDGVDPIPLTVFKQGNDFLVPVDFEQGTGTYAITIEDENGATLPTLTRLIGTVGVT